MSEPVEWADDGCPHSPRFNDRYRSRSGAVAQSVCVFIEGCSLPQRWHDKAEFTVLETGFGLGMNFLATWAAWELDARHCDDLHFVSVEAYPVSAADIARSALVSTTINQASNPLLLRLQDLAQKLVDAWQDWPTGIHRLRFADDHVELVLAVGEVLPMLKCLRCEADAVYLDGFSPAVNPGMWSHDTLQAVARHCRPGTTLATYTVAHRVREDLQHLGFCVEKRPGLPPKRHRLEAVFSPASRSPMCCVSSRFEPQDGERERVNVSICRSDLERCKKAP